MHYTINDIINALKKIGIKKGDIIFSHMNLGFFGVPEGGLSIDNIFKVFYTAIFEVLGSDGLLIVPTFTYSFCKGEIFDPENTPSNMGIFAETLRKHPRSCRTFDPIFSVCLHGNIKKIFPNGNVIISTECFGKGSIWDLMYKNNAKICNFNLDSASTFIHYVEKMLNVPYRYDKEFKGLSKWNGKLINHRVIYFVRDLKYYPDFKKFHKFAKEEGLVKSAQLGKGVINCITCKDTFKICKKLLNSDPYALARQSN